MRVVLKTKILFGKLIQVLFFRMYCSVNSLFYEYWWLFFVCSYSKNTQMIQKHLIYSPYQKEKFE